MKVDFLTIFRRDALENDVSYCSPHLEHAVFNLSIGTRVVPVAEGKCYFLMEYFFSNCNYIDRVVVDSEFVIKFCHLKKTR